MKPKPLCNLLMSRNNWKKSIAAGAGGAYLLQWQKQKWEDNEYMRALARYAKICMFGFSVINENLHSFTERPTLMGVNACQLTQPTMP